MLQHCKFSRATPDHPECTCENCGATVAAATDNVMRLCDVEAPDPHERDPGTLPCRWRGALLRREKADLPGTRGERVSVFACELALTVPDSVRAGDAEDVPRECCLESTLRDVRACTQCPHRDAGAAPRVGPPAVAPLRNGLPAAWEGECARKPWTYDVAAMIPVLDSVECLPLVVDLLRLQTLRPYILIVDTGSTPENFAKVEALRAEDVEVHSLRLNGFEHSSQSVAMACDVAFSVCQSRFLFMTHSDCFLRSRTVIEEFAGFCEDNPVVGYQISPRPHCDWHRMVGHTATMLDMDEMHRHGISWNFRRLCREFGQSIAPHPSRLGWPDTELGLYYACRAAGLPDPLLVGHEENHVTTKDARIHHVRSYPSSVAYSPNCAKHDEMTRAMREAEERIVEWEAKPLPQARKAWRRREPGTAPLPEFRKEWTRV